MDLGRVDMYIEKPPVPIITSGNTGKIQLEWEDHIALVSFRAK